VLKLGWADIFKDITGASRLKHSKQVVTGVGNGPSNDLDPWMLGHHRFRGCGAVQPRHMNIHENKVGLQLVEYSKPFGAGGRYADES
jgi:hypothetical protein